MLQLTDDYNGDDNPYMGAAGNDGGNSDAHGNVDAQGTTDETVEPMSYWRLSGADDLVLTA